MTGQSIAVVVVTYNSEAVLSEMVRSLPQGFGGQLSWRLVVADNDSADGTVALLEELSPECTLVAMGRNAGYAAGINAGIDAAGDHDAYLILNPDVRLHPGCMPDLLAALRRPGVGIAVPRLVDAQGELILSMRREPSVLRAVGDLLLGAERAGRISMLGEVVSDHRRYDRAGTTDWAEGSTQLISRDCWRRCGPWDESFFLYSEEADFDLRARDLGLATWYEPAAAATHLEGGSAGSARLWALLQTNRVRLFTRRHGPVSSAAFWLATVLREASRAALGRPANRAALGRLLSPRRLSEQPGPHSISARPRCRPAGTRTA